MEGILNAYSFTLFLPDWFQIQKEKKIKT